METPTNPKPKRVKSKCFFCRKEIRIIEGRFSICRKCSKPHKEGKFKVERKEVENFYDKI